ncbi:MAG: ATP-binding protein [bacterium]
MKSEFVSIVSHEIRSPLTTMKEFVSLILDEIPGKINKTQTEFLTIINENINRLTRLINNMLDITRIESGRMELNCQEMNINSVAEDIIKLFQTQAAEKDISIKNLLPQDLPTVYADVDKISQVLTNLIDNAIKFTKESGTVTIKGKKVNNQVEISIIDTGIGIAKEDFPLIFDKFHRLELPTNQKVRGTGLGLSISKAIVEIHHGKIRVESELEKGSNFTFSLPEYEEDIYFKDVLKRKFSFALQNRLFLSLLIVKIDNLEEGIADKMLYEVEKVCKEIVRRESDVVTGIKKNKSIAILSEINRKDAFSLRDRVLNALVSYKFLTQEGRAIEVIIRLGTATYPDDATTQDELLSKAEEETKGSKKHYVQNISG